ncbi:MAG: TetR family transcriptional regulator [Moraxellaceae bacterium]|jgi:AcrR family transcriptional regulator|nr:TetR family transcriptional regulator [Moraxellaceae bacterium]
MSIQQGTPKSSYHHGDLRRGMIEAAIALMEQEGIEALSLRKLAEQLGVSPPALYHHFRDKQALLCAIGEAAIDLFAGEMHDGLAEVDGLEARFERFVTVYVRFALGRPELYELLFGRVIWKGEGPESEAFRSKARASFRSYAEMVMSLQAQGWLPPDLNPLRLAQVMWGTLHGLCCMYNDGLAFSPGDVEEISQYARWLLQRLRHKPGRD